LCLIRIKTPDVSRLLLALSAPFLASDGLQGEMPGGLMEPTSEHGTILQLFSISGQRDKHSLAHFVRKLSIAEHSKGRRINEVDVAMNQLAERRFRTVPRILANQIPIRCVHLSIICRALQNRTYDLIVFSFKLERCIPHTSSSTTSPRSSGIGEKQNLAWNYVEHNKDFGVRFCWGVIKSG